MRMAICKCGSPNGLLSASRKKDSGETVVVGENYFADAEGGTVEYGEVFQSDPIAEAGSDRD